MTRPKKYLIIVVSLMVVLCGGYLARYHAARSHETADTDHPAHDSSKFVTSRYWDSITSYEKYIVTLEDDKHGYAFNAGYPLYLATIGSMYLQLYKKTHKSYHKEKLDRVLNYILSTKNDDWTWNMSEYDGPNSLYNTFFAKLFLDAYVETKEGIYLEHARKIIEAIDKFYVRSRLVTITNNGEYETYNPNFFAFAIIAYYCDISGNCSKDLLNMGRNLFQHSMKGYHNSSGLWEYDSLTNTRYRKYLKYLPHILFYNSHDAFYELLIISSLLEHKASINNIYPDLYASIYPELPKMVEGVKKYMLNDISSFNYDSEAPRCVECCADTALAFYLIDKEIGTNNSSIITKALNTITKNQDVSGVYYKSDGSNDVLLWYSDNIADKLPKMLNIIEAN